MDFRKIIKSFIPPIFFPFINKARLKVKVLFGEKPPYRSDIFKDYSQVTENFENIWESQNWINHVNNSLKFNLTSSPNLHQSALIYSIKALWLLKKVSLINVVDFGGGSGTLVPHILRTKESLNAEVNTVVIDSVKNINIGKNIIGNRNDVQFLDSEKTSLNKIFDNLASRDSETILYLSSVLQYILPYEKFLLSILKDKKPLMICVTRFPRSDNASDDAFAIQDITSPLGFCGSSIVNLFAAKTLVEVLDKIGYQLLNEDYNYSGDADYFINCDDESYRKITLVAYIFVRKFKT